MAARYFVTAVRQQVTHWAPEEKIDQQKSGRGQVTPFLALNLGAGPGCLEPDHGMLGGWTMA